MQVKKAFSVGVEVLVTSDDNWQATVRSMQNGQPLVVCETPEDLTEVFRKLSSEIGNQAEGEKAE